MGNLWLREGTGLPPSLAGLEPVPIPFHATLSPGSSLASMTWHLLSPSPVLSPHRPLCPPSGLHCEHPPPMVLLQTSPCDQYECQNGAQCIVVQQEPTCRCPPGFAGPRCEKLITVNFVGKDSYVELASAKVRPQANISLQVRPARLSLEGP